MAVSVVMPALEMAQETGKLVAWLKKEGEHVGKGEMLLEIETDKAVVEIEATGDGILAGISAQAGDVIPVGQTIGWLVQAGEQPPAVAAPARTGRRLDAAPAATAAASEPMPATGGGPRLSPKARRLAREHGVDVERVTGSGPGGEILADDIVAAARARPHSDAVSGVGQPDPGRTETPSTIGRLMAERTTQSWTTVPHFFVTRDVDATALNAAREAAVPSIERAHGIKVTHTDLIVMAVARTLRRHPRLNASWNAGGIVINQAVNVAVAMAVEHAVVTGAIHDADTAALDAIAVRRRELAERARTGRLQPSDISGATFTVSNLGMFDVDAFTAIIVPPQAAILAVGAIVDRVVAVDGEAHVRPMMTLTLSCDHRVVDGAGAAAFLKDAVTALRGPEPLRMS